MTLEKPVISPADILDILSAYPFGPMLDCGKLGGLSNTTYRVVTETQTVALRIYTPGHTSLEHIRLELEVLQHLARKQFRSPRLLAGKNDELLQQWRGCWVTASEFIEGVTADEVRLTPTRCANVGELLAQFQRALLDFQPTVPLNHKNSFAPSGDMLQQVGQAAREKAIAVNASQLMAQWERASEAFNPHAHDLAHGIIHGDLWPPNVICEGDEVRGLIDFDGCGYGATIIDFAVALMEFSMFRSEVMNLDAATSFVAGYLNAGGSAAVHDVERIVAAMEMACALWVAWEIIESAVLEEGVVIVQRLAMFADVGARQQFTRNIATVLANARA